MVIGVLDDNPALNRILGNTLTLAGYNVIRHTDPLAFLEAIQHQGKKVACIIVDFHLPGERTGVDVIALIRQTHPFLPALLISGDPSHQAAIQNLPHAAFCRKPFQLRNLLAALNQLQELETLQEERTGDGR